MPFKSNWINWHSEGLVHDKEKVRQSYQYQYWNHGRLGFAC